MKILFVLLASFTLAASTWASALSGSRFKKVIWVVFENANYQAALQQADFAAAAKKGVLFTNLTAEGHPSQGNYIAMIAGTNMGVRSDNSVDLNGNHLGDLLEKSGRDWRVYAEDYPGNCFTGKTSGDYARKHVPFMSFVNVSRDSRRCQKIESASRFSQDLAGNTLPELSMYIPNLRNDGHNTGVDYAGKFLTAQFGSLMAATTRSSDTLLVLTFDEAGNSPTNQIYTVLIGASVQPGSVNNQAVNHTALLKLIEEEFALGSLGQGDSSAPSLVGFWK